MHCANFHYAVSLESLICQTNLEFVCDFLRGVAIRSCVEGDSYFVLHEVNISPAKWEEFMKKFTFTPQWLSHARTEALSHFSINKACLFHVIRITCEDSPFALLVDIDFDPLIHLPKWVAIERKKPETEGAF